MFFKKLSLVTGGFDPIHSGHIGHFKAAKELGDLLVVGLNSDDWLTRKKGKPFLPIEERLCIIRELKMVDLALAFDDNDNSSRDLIRRVLDLYSSDVVFANGGDRTKDNIPEIETFGDDPRVGFEFGVGGDNKKNSSSWILKNYYGT